jgi:hypothetical protein
MKTSHSNNGGLEPPFLQESNVPKQKTFQNPYKPSDAANNENAASGVRYICIKCQCCEACVEDKYCGDCYRRKNDNEARARRNAV